MTTRLDRKILILGFVFLVVLISGWGMYHFVFQDTSTSPKFDGERAFEDARYQTGLGPRIPGSIAHSQVVDWITSQLSSEGWQTSLQETTMMGHPVKNIIARRLSSQNKGLPWIIIGAHYDSRLYADQDPNPDKHSQPVPGANDGGSGVAVLMELGRVLPSDLQKNVWLVFFDAEDNGSIPGWDWILGSRAFVASLDGKPDAAVIVDMIGDTDLNIYMERNSDSKLTLQIWKQAADLGYAAEFIPVPKYNMLDDHTPFLQAGVPAADLIDFDYPYWHTTEDTIDKISSRSLGIVGETLATWLIAAR
ncbi:MAG: M28 family peptidase [Anaerolineales bacterium]|jgi:glutaminyl-peptide cyclotransferase